MKILATMQADRLEQFARFLETHPGFYLELDGEDALVCGFHVGGCFLTITEMDRFVSSQPHLAPHEAALFGSEIPGLAEVQRQKLL
jgi:hypothetical protein